MNPVVIVGGGLSGLAAGVALSSAGFPVVLFEQRSTPGGRAYSFLDDATGTVVDNGQHVLIAGYARTMRLLETIGTRDRLSVQRIPQIVFHHPVKGFRRFRLPSFPPPFHLLGGVALTNLFSAVDKLGMLRAGAALRSFRDDRPGRVADMTIAAWLDSIGQSNETKRSFWEPLAIAIMNEHIGKASALVFVRSLRKAFLTDRRGAAIAIPTVGLTDLYVNAARSHIERHGGTVRCNADVVDTVADGTGVADVRLRDGERVACSALILAVPSFRVRSLLPERLRSTGYLRSIESVSVSPILSIHLWFRDEIMEHEFVGVIGRRIQWVFNRRKICREKRGGGHVSAVISAGHAFVDMSNAELTAIACDDLRALYGKSVGDPLHALVLREKRATFSCTPEVERIRPDAGTPLPNLFLAGDWTNTGYPATIEGAILSGERCADMIRAARVQSPDAGGGAPGLRT